MLNLLANQIQRRLAFLRKIGGASEQLAKIELKAALPQKAQRRAATRTNNRRRIASCRKMGRSIADGRERLVRVEGCRWLDVFPERPTSEIHI